MGCGCLSSFMIWALVIIVVLLGVGLVLGPIGASMLGIETPGILDVSKPHIALPSEALFHVAGFSVTNTLIASWFTIIVLVVVFYFCTRKMKLIPGKLQGLAEMALEMLLNFIEAAAGKEHARLLFAGVATIFIYVIANAYLALLPFFGTIGFMHEGTFVPLFRGANTDVNVPLSVAVVSAVLVETWGMRKLGFFKYVGEFINVGQIAQGMKQLIKGKVRPAITNIGFGIITFAVGLLEIFSHFIRIVSFTFRLFGNMTAGEILVLVSAFLIPLVFTIPFYGLELLIGLIQALIFAGLTLVFGVIAVSPSHEEQK
jgi:F-type H+-transporting ATPase subunit a